MGFVPFTFVDFIDIILVAVIMYWIYRMTKGTNAPYILSGIIAIYLLWVVVHRIPTRTAAVPAGDRDAPEALQLHHPHLLDG